MGLNPRKPFSMKSIILGICGRNLWNVSSLKTAVVLLPLTFDLIYLQFWFFFFSCECEATFPFFPLSNHCGQIWIFYNHSSKFECFIVHQAWSKLYFTYERKSEFLVGILILHSKKKTDKQTGWQSLNLIFLFSCSVSLIIQLSVVSQVGK